MCRSPARPTATRAGDAQPVGRQRHGQPVGRSSRPGTSVSEAKPVTTASAVRPSSARVAGVSRGERVVNSVRSVTCPCRSGRASGALAEDVEGRPVEQGQQIDQPPAPGDPEIGIGADVCRCPPRPSSCPPHPPARRPRPPASRHRAARPAAAHQLQHARGIADRRARAQGRNTMSDSDICSACAGASPGPERHAKSTPLHRGLLHPLGHPAACFGDRGLGPVGQHGGQIGLRQGRVEDTASPSPVAATSPVACTADRRRRPSPAPARS
jgi:hypothetical protein